jgi:hypothetical protein
MNDNSAGREPGASTDNETTRGTIMNRTTILLAAIALTVTAAQAAESIDSANYVMQGCRSFMKNERSDFQQGICAGTVNAILLMAGGGMKSAVDTDPNRSGALHNLIRDRMCLDVPSAATGGQATRIVIAYIDARPERMHEQFSLLALEALRTAWPCRK